MATRIIVGEPVEPVNVLEGCGKVGVKVCGSLGPYMVYYFNISSKTSFSKNHIDTLLGLSLQTLISLPTYWGYEIIQ